MVYICGTNNIFPKKFNSTLISTDVSSSLKYYKGDSFQFSCCHYFFFFFSFCWIWITKLIFGCDWAYSSRNSTFFEFQLPCKTTSFWLLGFQLCYKTLSLFLPAFQLWSHIASLDRCKSLLRCLWRKKAKQKKQVIDCTQSLCRLSQKEGQTVTKSTTGAPRRKRLSVGVSCVLLCGW